MASNLDRIVKGAPDPALAPTKVASAARRSLAQSDDDSITAPRPPSNATDPTSSLPSSPPQIYLNLLILEASLRVQYLSLRARLRLHALLLGALAAWTFTFTYLLFLRPREDGKGQGGSVYWVVETGEKLGFVGGAVTWGLVWATGMWDRGVRWPRRWISVTNRGLRGFNLKLVVLRGPWYKTMFGHLALFDPTGWLAGTTGMRYEQLPRDVERLSEKRLGGITTRKDAFVDEDVAPGGDAVRLLLLPKSFSPDFRQEWDAYRAAFWEKENERRAELRTLVKARKREQSRRGRGMFWRIGWRAHTKTHTKVTGLHRQTHLRKEARLADSRATSRSSTPAPTNEHDSRPRKAGAERSRRNSSTQATSRSRPPSRSPTPTMDSGGRAVTKKPSKLGLGHTDDEKSSAKTNVRIDEEIN